MKNIVALVDLSDLTFKILKHAHTLAKAFNSHVIICHVAEREPVVVDVGIASPVIMQQPSQAKLEKHYAQLLEARDSLVKFGVSAIVEQLECVSVDKVLEQTKKWQADLIILGSHHHSTFYNLMVGSVTDNVLRRAYCPVLVVPGDDEAPQ